jgi:hypothetical protein
VSAKSPTPGKPAAKPPPPPPRHRAQPPAAERRSALPPPSMSAGQKQSVALQALGLLNEQIEARIVHYKAELETSPELDAVTAQVVQQLKAMQAAAAAQTPPTRLTAEQLETQQLKLLISLLARLFGQDGANFMGQNLKPIGRRIAKLFFESELHEKTKADKDKVIHHAEQGVYYVLQRHRHRIAAELDGFEYVSDDIRELSKELLAKLERDLQIGFLSRRSPELNRVMTIYTAVLADFLQTHLPPRLEQMAKLTIRAAGTARRPNSVPYKILADGFPDFRKEWERLLMQQMVHFCEDELLSRLGQSHDEVREETLKFFTDPHIFSETCAVLCDSLYDFLCLEGFLDLPVQWRATFAREA